MADRHPKGIAMILVTRGALDTKNAVITEARSYMAGPIRTESVRRCQIQILDRGREPESAKEARRN